jgi:hypothetical protein
LTVLEAAENLDSPFLLPEPNSVNSVLRLPISGL